MIEQHRMLGAERRDGLGPPGRQAVGIERDAQSLGQTILVQRRHLALQVTLQQTHLLHMVEQPLAQLGRPWRRAAQQYRLTDPRLEQLDALRHCRLRQAEHRGGALEAGLFDHRGQRGEQLVIEHQFS
ncbi:hypothetical protein D3C77_619770 [compost metagenome]